MMRLRLSRTFIVTALLALAACGGGESAEKPDDAVQQGEAGEPPAAREPAAASDSDDTSSAAPAPAADEPAPAAAADPASDAAPAPAAKPAVAQDLTRSADGIDDENAYPTDKNSPAFASFKQASETARTQPAKAVDEFVNAANKTTYFYAAWFNAGAAAEAAGDAAKAEQHYRKALEVRPDYGPALTNLYLLLTRSGKAADGDRLIDGALSKYSDRAGPHVAAAMRAYVKRQPEKVKAEALKAIAIDERAVPAMRMMGWVFFEQGRYETAKFALENALALEPGNALLHLELGHVQMKLDEEPKALQSYSNASKLRPDLAEALENYGVLVLKTGDADAAAVALTEVVKLRPKSAKAQMHLANALRAQKKYKEAEAAYKKALSLDAKLDEVHFNLGVLYLDNAIPEMDDVVRLETAQAELSLFAEKQNPDGDLKARIEDYTKTLKKRIKREKKKRKREAERKAIEEEEKKALKEAPPAEEAPAEANSAEGEGAAAGGNPEASADVAPEGTDAAEAAASDGDK